MKISLAQARGSRSYQEDTFGIERLFAGTLVWVADGHGGEETSQYVRHNILNTWITKDNDNKEEQIKGTFAALHEATKDIDAGSTLSLAYITRSTVHVAVLGDSPVLVSADGQNYVGPDHNARSNEKERKAAIDRGAIYSGGYVCLPQASYGGFIDAGPGLQMTRALGDSHLKFLNREPEIRVLSFGNHGDFVLVASDGLVDPSHHNNAEIDVIAGLIEAGAEAPELVTRATKLPTGDNVTAILVKP